MIPEKISCGIKMTRYRFKHAVIDGESLENEIKIERWEQSGKSSIIEISMTGENSDKHFNFFKDKIASALLKRSSIEPIFENKSETEVNENPNDKIPL